MQTESTYNTPIFGSVIESKEVSIILTIPEHLLLLLAPVVNKRENVEFIFSNICQAWLLKSINWQHEVYELLIECSEMDIAQTEEEMDFWYTLCEDVTTHVDKYVEHYERYFESILIRDNIDYDNSVGAYPIGHHSPLIVINFRGWL